MAQPEARLSRKIQGALEDEGAWCFKVHGSAFQPAGIPDILGVVDGLFFGFETKMPGKRDNTSPRQRYIARKIRAAGGHVAVVTSVDEALASLAALRDSAGTCEHCDQPHRDSCPASLS